MGRAVAASLEPQDARHQIDVSTGHIVTTQIDRPPLVLAELHVPCACGRPLVGAEYAIFSSDADNGTVFVRGVCLHCGVQSAIFAPPLLNAPTAEETRLRSLKAEVEALLEKIHAFRSPSGEAAA